MRRQDPDWVGTYMGLRVKVCDPDTHQYISSPINVSPAEHILYDMIFVVLCGVRWVFVTFRVLCACHVRSLSQVSLWIYKWFSASLTRRMGKVVMAEYSPHHIVVACVY